MGVEIRTDCYYRDDDGFVFGGPGRVHELSNGTFNLTVTHPTSFKGNIAYDAKGVPVNPHIRSNVHNHLVCEVIPDGLGGWRDVNGAVISCISTHVWADPEALNTFCTRCDCDGWWDRDSLRMQAYPSGYIRRKQA